jgi:lysozyme
MASFAPFAGAFSQAENGGVRFTHHTDAQWIALVSVFNEGETKFLTSTLLRSINAGDYASVPAQLARWNKETVNGVLRINAGLTNRRTTEIQMWNRPQ